MRLQLFANPPYMHGWAKVADDGTVTTFVRTGEAVVALPYRYVWEINDYRVVLLRQRRPEIGDTVIKTVGGYIRDGETAEECALRNLRDKLGISTDILFSCGRMQGYTVIQVPISIHITDAWKIVADPAEGCELVEMSLEEGLALTMRNEVADDSTSLPLFRLDHLIRHNTLAPSRHETRTP